MIRTSETEKDIQSYEDVLRINREGEGGVVPVRSESFALSGETGTASSVPMAERRFTHNSVKVRIWEETGESIARHIWYARRYVSPAPPAHMTLGTPA